MTATYHHKIIYHDFRVKIFITHAMNPKINPKEYDALGELFRTRLENHTMPVDNGSWEILQRSLSNRKKRMAAWWLSALSTSAAAAVALIITLRTPSTPTLPYPATAGIEMPVRIEKPTHNPSVTTPSNHEPLLSTLPPSEPQSPHPNPHTPIPTPQSPHPNPHFSFLTSLIPLPHTPYPTLSDTNLRTLAENEIPKLDVSLVADLPEEEAGAFAKKKQKWLLAATFGTGSYAGGNQDFSDAPQMSASATPWSGSGNEYAADLSGSIQSFDYMRRNDFSDISHLPPLTAGLTVRKNIGKRAGIESGLTYTFLSSHFKWSEWADYGARQHLHYIGIPLNMVVYLSQEKSSWRVYLSGGFAIEKGIRARYIQDSKQSNAIYTTTVKCSIDGLQTSLTGALGINYRIADSFCFYIEPRAGYYFDCEQPVSARTEWPLYVGIGIGLNYEL